MFKSIIFKYIIYIHTYNFKFSPGFSGTFLTFPHIPTPPEHFQYLPASFPKINGSNPKEKAPNPKEKAPNPKEKAQPKAGAMQAPIPALFPSQPHHSRLKDHRFQ